MINTAQNESTGNIAAPPCVDNHLNAFVHDLTVFYGLSASSVASYRRIVSEFFAWLAGNDDLRPVDHLVRQDVEDYLEWCFFRNNGNNTRIAKLIALHRYARFLRRKGLIPIDRDFTIDVPKPKVDKRRIQKLTLEEQKAFFRAIDPKKEKGLRDLVIFILAGFCGLRAGEIRQLRLEHIQDNGKLIDILIPEDITKQAGHGSEGRDVSLWALPSRDVRRYVAIRYSQGARYSDPLLITYRNKRAGTRTLYSSDLDWLVKYYAKRSGIQRGKITLHMFRATHASRCRNVQGYDTPAIAERLGHANIATTDRYLPQRHRLRGKPYPSFADAYDWYAEVWDEKKEDGDKNIGIQENKNNG